MNLSDHFAETERLFDELWFENLNEHNQDTYPLDNSKFKKLIVYRERTLLEAVLRGVDKRKGFDYEADQVLSDLATLISSALGNSSA